MVFPTSAYLIIKLVSTPKTTQAQTLQAYISLSLKTIDGIRDYPKDSDNSRAPQKQADSSNHI